MKKALYDTVVINHYMSDVFIESITMLGNTPTEILEALKYFSDERICIVSEKEKFRSLSSNYSEKTSQYEMLVRTLKSLSEFDVVVDAETNKVLNKYSNVVHELKLGYSMRNVAEICKVSLNTVKKVKKLMES